MKELQDNISNKYKQAFVPHCCLYLEGIGLSDSGERFE